MDGRISFTIETPACFDFFCNYQQKVHGFNPPPKKPWNDSMSLELPTNLLVSTPRFHVVAIVSLSSRVHGLGTFREDHFRLVSTESWPRPAPGFEFRAGRKRGAAPRAGGALHPTHAGEAAPRKIWAKNGCPKGPEWVWEMKPRTQMLQFSGGLILTRRRILRAFSPFDYPKIDSNPWDGCLFFGE